MFTQQILWISSGEFFIIRLDPRKWSKSVRKCKNLRNFQNFLVNETISHTNIQTYIILKVGKSGRTTKGDPEGKMLVIITVSRSRLITIEKS